MARIFNKIDALKLLEICVVVAYSQSLGLRLKNELPPASAGG
ncbi:hypothetical protein [Flavobacterium potami]|nr:hypothetical protein [Flavobacterium potami]